MGYLTKDRRDAMIDGHPSRCTARAKSTGDQCKRWAIAGGSVCRVHGGGAAQVRAKAKRRLTETQAMKMLEQLGAGPADDRHPIDHLLAELRQAAVASDYLGSVAVMEGPRSGIWHAWERERDRRAKLAKMALDAGVEERRVRVAEDHAAEIASVLRAVMTAVGARLRDVLSEALVPPEPEESMIVLDVADRSRLEAAIRGVTTGEEGLGIVQAELRKMAADDGHGTDVP